MTQGGCSEPRVTHDVVKQLDYGDYSTCCVVCVCATIYEIV